MNIIDNMEKRNKIVLIKKGKKMRIIGGTARGTKLYTLNGENTRPTLDRVKESLFNIIQNEIIDANVLDLFSGSGAIGLEAVSRGARKSILCDKEKQAIEIIRKNVQKTHMEQKVEIYNLDFKKILKEKIKEKQDIIFLDPPYKTDYIAQALELIYEEQLIDAQSIIIIETDEEERIIKNIDNEKFEIYDKRKYGRAYLIFLRKT